MSKADDVNATFPLFSERNREHPTTISVDHKSDKSQPVICNLHISPKAEFENRVENLDVQ
jgi:hypothetical protein